MPRPPERCRADDDKEPTLHKYEHLYWNIDAYDAMPYVFTPSPSEDAIDDLLDKVGYESLAMLMFPPKDEPRGYPK